MSKKKSDEEIVYELIEFDDTPDDFYLKADIIKAMHEHTAQETESLQAELTAARTRIAELEKELHKEKNRREMNLPPNYKPID